jgi:hypothetical protein
MSSIKVAESGRGVKEMRRIILIRKAISAGDGAISFFDKCLAGAAAIVVLDTAQAMRNERTFVAQPRDSRKRTQSTSSRMSAALR